MDISETVQPRSDQTNADDFLAGPKTVTITEVRQGASPEQPVDILLAEFGPGRPFKPSKTVRRLLISAWGAEAEAYVGRKMTLYCDPDVKFGGATVGGIRVSEMSDIAKPLTVALTVTRGKRKSYTVTPLAEAVGRDWLTEAHATEGDVDLLRALYGAAQKANASPKVLEAIRALATGTPDVAPAA